jgi:hypothetical protein
VIVKDQISSLRRVGVRTVLDFQAAGAENGLSTLAQLSEMSGEQLSTVYRVISEDPDVDTIARARKNLSES